MKRRRAGWPPNSHVYRAFNQAALIDRALKAADRRDPDTGQPEAAPTTAELHRRIQEVIEPREWRVLAALIAVYPGSLSREDLATRTGYDVTGGGYRNLLSSLNSLGFTGRPSAGQVVALPILFVEG